MKRLVKWVAFSVLAVAALIVVQMELTRLLAAIRRDTGNDIRSWLVLGHIGGTMAAFAVTGVLLGLEGYLRERARDGRWQVDWPRVLALGLPMTLIALSNIWIFLIPPSLDQAFSLWWSRLPVRLINGPLSYLAGTIAGYAIISSFRKSTTD